MTVSRCSVLVIGLAAILTGSDSSLGQSTTLEGLDRSIRAHTQQEHFAESFWGIKIESLDNGRVLFEHNADRLLQPASTAKIFTAALALDRLGPQFRLRTSFYAKEPPSRSGTLNGDLFVYGRGDVSFSARFHDGDDTASFAPIIEAVKRAGIRQIRGGLVGDVTYFRGPPFGAGWTWDDLQSDYGAEVTALSYEDNVVDLILTPGSATGSTCRIQTHPQTACLTFVNRTITVDSGDPRLIELYRPNGGNGFYVTGQLPIGGTNWIDAIPVHAPPLWFIEQLQRTLKTNQIRIRRPPRIIDWLSPLDERPDYARMVEVAFVESPPMEEVVRVMMKQSQNLYAQTILLQVGHHRQSLQSQSNPGITTEQAGIAELQDFIAEAGIPSRNVELEEGSGLSRRALVTPNALVALLRYMAQHRYSEAFQASLPVAGVDGTLRRRMIGTSAQGRVRAKTGTLAHVHTLAGYVTTAAGERLVFAFMLNNLPEASAYVSSDLDTLVILLASLRERS